MKFVHFPEIPPTRFLQAIVAYLFVSRRQRGEKTLVWETLPLYNRESIGSSNIPANHLMLSHFFKTFLKIIVENRYEGKPFISKTSLLSTFIEKLSKTQVLTSRNKHDLLLRLQAPRRTVRWRRCYGVGDWTTGSFISVSPWGSDLDPGIMYFPTK